MGVNVPPLHPNCRSEIIPYDEEDFLRHRAKMGYEEWLAGYAEEYFGVGYIAGGKDLSATSISPEGLEVLKAHEGELLLKPRQIELNDGKKEKYYTVGWGHVIKPGDAFFGKTMPTDYDDYCAKMEQLEITKEQAEALLSADNVKHSGYVVAFAKQRNLSFTPSQFDGLSMLAYNTPSAFDEDSKQFQDLIADYINKGCPKSMEEEVLNEFGTYRIAAEQIMPGLWKRNVLNGLIFCGYGYDVVDKYDTPEKLESFLAGLGYKLTSQP